MSVPVNNCSEESSTNLDDDSGSEENFNQNDTNDISEPIYALKMLNLCKDLFLFTVVFAITYATFINE